MKTSTIQAALAAALLILITSNSASATEYGPVVEGDQFLLDMKSVCGTFDPVALPNRRLRLNLPELGGDFLRGYYPPKRPGLWNVSEKSRYGYTGWVRYEDGKFIYSFSTIGHGAHFTCSN